MAQNLQSYKEETVEIKPNQIKNKNAFIDIANAEYNDVNTIELLSAGMFNVEIIENKIILKRKKPQYPKTYIECCDILYPNGNFQIIAPPFKGHNYKKLFALQQLLICRDTYWKIAGEQMGLGKPWEPDWGTLDKKYNIYNYRGDIKHDYFTVIDRCLLVFPTTEMRDAFYENFKNLIEFCKELL